MQLIDINIDHDDPAAMSDSSGDEESTQSLNRKITRNLSPVAELSLFATVFIHCGDLMCTINYIT